MHWRQISLHTRAHMIFKKIFASMLFLLVGAGANAQGISGRLIDYSTFISKGGYSGLSWGIGYEQNVTKHLALSLSYNSSWGHTDDETSEYSYDDGSGYGYTFTYFQDFTWHEFAYESKYFFDGNDDNSMYLSSGIAYREVSHLTTIDNVWVDPGYYDVYDALAQTYYRVNFSCVPITIKWGERGEMDGLFTDVYVGVTFIPGASGKLPGTYTFFTGKTEQKVNTISFCAGLKIGIGWDK